jgi:hypothetical protein
VRRFAVRLAALLAAALLLIREPLAAAAFAAPQAVPGGGLIVVTTDLCDGRSLAGALVTLAGPASVWQVSAADGRALFLGLPAGHYLVGDQADDHQAVGSGFGDPPLGVDVTPLEAPAIAEIVLAPLGFGGPASCR